MWLLAIGLASTRVLVLAHYVTDIAVGLGLGAAVGGTVRKLLNAAGHRSQPLNSGGNVIPFPNRKHLEYDTEERGLSPS
jgi:membrane-associated phospholipid phosphatase